jgi:hypothetical protein
MRTKRPLTDAAAVNASRWALFRHLQATGLPLETGSGGGSTWQRTTRGLATAQWLDAACVGASTPHARRGAGIAPLGITATGRHRWQLSRRDACGLPPTAAKATSVVGGLRTGDRVRAVVSAPSRTAGTSVGRLAVRATCSCTVTTPVGVVQGLPVRCFQPLQRGDGYSYRDQQGRSGAAAPCRKAGVSAPHRG